MSDYEKLTKHAELVELEKKITARPWALDPHYQSYLWGPQSQMIADDGQDEEGTLTRMRGVGANLPLKENGDFIAALRNAAPTYFAVVEKAKAVANKYDTYHSPEWDALREVLAKLEEL